MTCTCKCHDKKHPSCPACLNYHKLEEEFTKSPGFLIDQKLEAFFMDRADDDSIKKLIFVFEKGELQISWDKELDSFKFSVATR